MVVISLCPSDSIFNKINLNYTMYKDYIDCFYLIIEYSKLGYAEFFVNHSNIISTVSHNDQMTNIQVLMFVLSLIVTTVCCYFVCYDEIKEKYFGNPLMTKHEF